MSQINAQAQASAFTETDILSDMWTLIIAARSELMLFVVAMLAYFILFMQRTPKNPKSPARKLKAVDEDYKEEDYPTDAYTKGNALEPQQHAQVEQALRSAFEGGDYRAVLRCWNAMKRFEKMPTVSLSQVVESMQRFKKDTSFVLRELKLFMKKFSGDVDMICVNDLLESLAKRLDSDLMEKIVEMLPSIDFKMDASSYEIFLNMYFTTRSFQDVKSLASQMKAKKIPFTTRSVMAVIKTALKTNNFDEALEYFRELRNVWTTQSISSTPSAAPGHVVSQLAELACREHRLNELLAELGNMAITEEVIITMLTECVRQKDLSLTSSVEKLAREKDVHFTDATYALLIKGMASNPVRVQELFAEIVEKGVDVTSDLAGSVLSFCAQTSNMSMAEQLYEHMKPTQVSVLAVFIRFFADSEQYEKACQIYEHDLLQQHSAGPMTQQPFHLDPRIERSLMNAALKCGRAHLAKDLLSSSPSDVAKHIAMIKNCASEKNVQGAMSVFDSLESSGVSLNSVIYNTVLDACVECRDLKAAEEWMERTNKAGMADVVSFNTLIKAHLQNGNFDKARSLMDQLQSEGLEANRVTFNELINFLVSKGGEARRKQMWDIVEEMTSTGVKPNQVTISILLKSLTFHSGARDISNTMDLIETMEEPMDEVLLSSVVEACVRIGKPDLLASKLKQIHGSTAVIINGSHTYGSLIKAYGHARDIDGVWRCWKEMRSRHIKPTSITLGCMVEAIVGNGDTEGAYDLIHQMQEDEQCCSALNSVIYCSVLKGFTREKKMDRVWAVYQEMNQRHVELSVVTYNTLIDGCARSGRMDHLPTILEDMKTHRVKPNVITYSTMLKGHCQNGDVQTGFLILEQMKDSSLKPDEIMYNSLLDGCAQNNLVDEGLRLLERMQSEGVRPSNFTLSILVKLMNRARRLDQAFLLVEEITKKYSFKPNVHVYTNLVQACVYNQHFNRGMGILEQMIKERIVPDNRTYAILVRASMSKVLPEQAVGLLRGALGLEDALPFLQSPIAVCPNLDTALVNETLAGLADRGHAQDLAVPLLSSIRQGAPKVRVDAATQRKVMSPCLASTAESSSWSPGVVSRQGKGKGKGGHPWDRR